MKTIGDIWRESTNEELAQSLLEVIITIYHCLGISDEDIDIQTQYDAMLKMFDTEVDEELEDRIFLN